MENPNLQRIPHSSGLWTPNAQSVFLPVTHQSFALKNRTPPPTSSSTTSPNQKLPPHENNNNNNSNSNNNSESRNEGTTRSILIQNGMYRNRPRTSPILPSQQQAKQRVVIVEDPREGLTDRGDLDGDDEEGEDQEAVNNNRIDNNTHNNNITTSIIVIKRPQTTSLHERKRGKRFYNSDSSSSNSNSNGMFPSPIITTTRRANSIGDLKRGPVSFRQALEKP